MSAPLSELRADDPPRIALFGLFGGGNLGNEATLAAAVHAVRERVPHARLVLLSQPPEARAGLPELEAMGLDLLPVGGRLRSGPLRRLRRWLLPALVLLTEPRRRALTRERAHGFDTLLVPGTGIADDYQTGPFEVAFHLRRWCAAVQEAGGRVRFLSIGAGPVANPLGVRWFRQALSSADYRSYREPSSHRFAVRIGVDARHDPVLPDLVFSLPVDDYLERRPLRWPPREVGLGVMAFRGWNAGGADGRQLYVDYLDRLRLLTQGLLDRGYDVRLLAGARVTDPAAAQDLLALLAPEDRARVGAPEITTYRDALEHIASSDLVIASRFHTVVKSLLLERPTISLEYGRKNSQLMHDVGLEDYCHTADAFDVDSVLSQVDQLAAQPVAPVAGIRARVSDYRAQLQRQFDEVVGTVTRIEETT